VHIGAEVVADEHEIEVFYGRAGLGTGRTGAAHETEQQ
jgi:hypothetical protein